MANVKYINQTGAQLVTLGSNTVTMTANTTYIINNGATLVTLTLPSAPVIGDTYNIIGGSSGGWTIAQNASQQINQGATHTTAGVTGTLSSAQQYNCVGIKFFASNQFVIFTHEGTLTFV